MSPRPPSQQDPKWYRRFTMTAASCPPGYGAPSSRHGATVILGTDGLVRSHGGAALLNEHPRSGRGHRAGSTHARGSLCRGTRSATGQSRRQRRAARRQRVEPAHQPDRGDERSQRNPLALGEKALGQLDRIAEACSLVAGGPATGEALQTQLDKLKALLEGSEHALQPETLSDGLQDLLGAKSGKER